MNFARQYSTKLIAIITLIMAASIVDLATSPGAIEQANSGTTGVGWIVTPVVRYVAACGAVPALLMIWLAYGLFAYYMLEAIRASRKPFLSEVD